MRLVVDSVAVACCCYVMISLSCTVCVCDVTAVLSHIPVFVDSRQSAFFD